MIFCFCAIPRDREKLQSIKKLKCDRLTRVCFLAQNFVVLITSTLSVHGEALVNIKTSEARTNRTGNLKLSNGGLQAPTLKDLFSETERNSNWFKSWNEIVWHKVCLLAQNFVAYRLQAHLSHGEALVNIKNSKARINWIGNFKIIKLWTSSTNLWKVATTSVDHLLDKE